MMMTMMTMKTRTGRVKVSLLVVKGAVSQLKVLVRRQEAQVGL
jgi:hypothetical protein